MKSLRRVPRTVEPCDRNPKPENDVPMPRTSLGLLSKSPSQIGALFSVGLCFLTSAWGGSRARSTRLQEALIKKHLRALPDSAMALVCQVLVGHFGVGITSPRPVVGEGEVAGAPEMPPTVPRVAEMHPTTSRTHCNRN